MEKNRGHDEPVEHHGQSQRPENRRAFAASVELAKAANVVMLSIFSNGNACIVLKSQDGNISVETVALVIT